MAAAATTTTTTTASSSSGFFSFRSGNAGRASSSSCAAKLDGVTAWLVNGVAAAFFTSLERCSCIRINTMEDVEEGNDVMPLVINDGNCLRNDGGATASRRRTAKGKNKGSGRQMLMMED